MHELMWGRRVSGLGRAGGREPDRDRRRRSRGAARRVRARAGRGSGRPVRDRARVRRSAEERVSRRRRRASNRRRRRRRSAAAATRATNRGSPLDEARTSRLSCDGDAAAARLRWCRRAPARRAEARRALKPARPPSRPSRGLCDLPSIRTDRRAGRRRDPSRAGVAGSRRSRRRRSPSREIALHAPRRRRADDGPAGLITGHEPDVAVGARAIALRRLAAGARAGRRHRDRIRRRILRAARAQPPRGDAAAIGAAAPGASSRKCAAAPAAAATPKSDGREVRSQKAKSEARQRRRREAPKSERPNSRKPPSEAVRAAPTAGCCVRSTPAGARVFVDGTDYGRTPATVRDLPRGAHRVRDRRATATRPKSGAS